MFIDGKRNVATLRQEGHVSNEGNVPGYTGLLTEAVDAHAVFYKHYPPDGGRRHLHVLL